MNKLFIDRIFKIAISITCVIIFFIPFCSVIDISNEVLPAGQWKTSYLWEDLISTVIYALLTILWLIFLFTKKPGIFFKIILVLYGLFCFYISFSSVVMAAQDYEPGLGAYISLFIFPLIAVYLLAKKNSHSTTPQITL